MKQLTVRSEVDETVPSKEEGKVYEHGDLQDNEYSEWEGVHWSDD